MFKEKTLLNAHRNFLSISFWGSGIHPLPMCGTPLNECHDYDNKRHQMMKLKS